MHDLVACVEAPPPPLSPSTSHTRALAGSHGELRTRGQPHTSQVLVGAHTRVRMEMGDEEGEGRAGGEREGGRLRQKKTDGVSPPPPTCRLVLARDNGGWEGASHCFVRLRQMTVFLGIRSAAEAPQPPD